MKRFPKEYFDIHSLEHRLRNSSFAKDSFWAVFGNGIGNFLLLLAGIFIARLLGKDLYGEYGLVKTTMFYIASFATFGLSDTSTRYIAQYVQKDTSKIRNIVKASLRITLITSSTLCFLLLLTADWLANFINTPQMASAFRYLGAIIIFRALNTVGAGILGGFKDYKHLGRNNIISGVVMFALSIPLTYYGGLRGSLVCLLISQVLLSVLNLCQVYSITHKIATMDSTQYDKELFLFSLPFALRELIFTITAWGTSLLLTKYSSVGELGMYTACTQWNAIILFMPSLLGNVILSYLSTSVTRQDNSQARLVKRMLLINFVCTIIPFFIVLIFSPYIAKFYGSTFDGMRSILSIIIIGTIFQCLTRVFQSNLVSEGRNWLASTIPMLYNTAQLIVVFVVLKLTAGNNAAMNMAIINVSFSLIIFLIYLILYRYSNKHKITA